MADELVFDSGAALERMDGDWDLFLQVAEVLVEDAAGVMDELREAIRCGDVERLARAAHCLRGSVTNVAATSVRDAAFRLEQSARRCDLAQSRREMDVVEQQMALLVTQITAVITSNGTRPVLMGALQ